jgi:hypothetical protein
MPVEFDEIEQFHDFDDIRVYNSPRDFHGLQKFLLEMKMQANYQPIMIRTLLLSGGRSTKNSIASEIAKLNPEIPKQNLLNIPVYTVLERHGIVKKESDSEFVLHATELTSEEREQLIALCNWRIYDLPLQIDELIRAFDEMR